MVRKSTIRRKQGKPLTRKYLHMVNELQSLAKRFSNLAVELENMEAWYLADKRSKRQKTYPELPPDSCRVAGLFESESDITMWQGVAARIAQCPQCGHEAPPQYVPGLDVWVCAECRYGVGECQI